MRRATRVRDSRGIVSESFLRTRDACRSPRPSNVRVCCAQDARYAAVMEPKAILRQLSPSAYRSAVRLRRGSLARAAGAPARAKAKRQFAAGAPLTVDVATSMGLGAILLHAAQGLYAGQAFGVDVALSFTSP